jgi:hypothetical protein
MLQDEELKK